MSEDIHKQLVIASEEGETAKVKWLLAEGADPNAQGPNSGALHVAAFGGHKDIVDMLLKADADPNRADAQGYYPLQLAASKDEVSILKLLVAAGAELEKTTEAGGTALHVAVASGFTKATKALLKAGANIGAQDNFANTALLIACGFGHLALVKALLKAGASLRDRNKAGETALIRSLKALYNYRINHWYSEGMNGNTPVRYEILKGCFTYTKAGHTQVLNLKDQRYCASQSWGPSEHLKYLGALDTVREVLKAGADVHEANDNQQSPMAVACHCGEARLIRDLHKAGAQLDHQDWQGATPAHYAAGCGRPDGLNQYLDLAGDLNLNAPDNFGWRPLHYLADIGGTKEMADALLARGADPRLSSTVDRDAQLPKGMTPADVARRWNDADMAAWLN